MSRWGRRAALSGTVVAIAVALIAVGSAMGAPDDADPGPQAVATAAPGSALTRSISALQERLRSRPENAQGWAELGLAYVSQARETANPSFYAKAQGAFDRSLSLQRKDNDVATTGLATLAAARHEFPRALQLADASLRINGFSATTYGVKADALTELGRYDQAAQAVQKMLDLQPGTPSFARASYQRELRGDVAGAREALERALSATTVPSDKAFSRHFLGELAWHNGDRAVAQQQYDAALAVDQSYWPALVGKAKALAPTDPTAALALYREAVQAQPEPSYVIELGELLEATGQQAAAKEQYDVVRAVQQLFAAEGANVDLELALFEADHGKPDTALRYAADAYRTRPDAILVQDAYAWALHVSGRSAEALPIARRAARLGTKLPVLAYHRGVIEAAVGEKAAARASLRQALALNPEFHPLQADKARALLATLG